MEDWVHVRRCREVVYWSEKDREELVHDTIDASKFVASCSRFLLPDPRQQALMDIPRMRLALDKHEVPTLGDLEQSVPSNQHALCWVLCTQIVFGTPYECATVNLPEDWIVCEAQPARRASVQLKTRGGRIKSFSAIKEMRALNMATGQTMHVGLAVWFHIESNRIQVSACRWR